MKTEKFESNLAGIRELLGGLQEEIAGLEYAYVEVLKRLETLQEESGRDDLTGLLRRKAFFSKWKKLLAQCEQTHQESGIMIIDIDHFKKVNDTYGHSTGDEVIKNVAHLLKRFESSNFVAGRLGGEEFVVALKGSLSEVTMKAEEIREEVSQLSGKVSGNAELSSHQQWKCTVSIGAAMAGPNTGGVDQALLLNAADEALYIAKRGGRNQVQRAA